MGKHEDDKSVDEDFLREQALGLAALEIIAARQAADKELKRRPDGRITNE